MTQTVKLSRRAALLMPLALGGCGMFDWLSDEAKPPIKGNREPILSPARGLQIDAAFNLTLPPLIENPSWPMPGGDLTHSGGNLAGGLGKPVWVMLPFRPDWRWLLDRDDSPWYPTARLFRQSEEADWDGVVQRVSEALGSFGK